MIGARGATIDEDQAEVGPGGGTVIRMHLTQSALAGMVGATRESVNKHLRLYQARGIIAMERQRITIQRPDELRRRIS